MGYVATIGDELSNDISIIDNALQFESDPEIRQDLLLQKSQLQQAQRLNLSRQYKFTYTIWTLSKYRNAFLS